MQATFTITYSYHDLDLNTGGTLIKLDRLGHFTSSFVPTCDTNDVPADLRVGPSTC